jgi:hypothetical protein
MANLIGREEVDPTVYIIANATGMTAAFGFEVSNAATPPMLKP